jgi:hypothetical protein
VKGNSARGGPKLILFGTILYSLIKIVHFCLFINNYSLILKPKI